MSQSSIFAEHRCSCGKLLFKGFLVFSIVEVKCRRCGALKMWKRFGLDGFVVIETEPGGVITEVAGDMRGLLNSTREYILGKRVSELYPLLRDRGATQNADAARGDSFEAPYVIRDHMFRIEDGAAKRVKTCVFPKRRGGAIEEGFCILMWDTLKAD